MEDWRGRVRFISQYLTNYHSGFYTPTIKLGLYFYSTTNHEPINGIPPAPRLLLQHHAHRKLLH
jgi:hypothetical protein